MARPRRWWRVIVAGLVATPVSVGLQGLDALDLPLSGLAQRLAWETGLETSYGLTAIAAAFALFAGLFGVRGVALGSRASSRSLALLGTGARAGAQRPCQHRRAAAG